MPSTPSLPFRYPTSSRPCRGPRMQRLVTRDRAIPKPRVCIKHVLTRSTQLSGAGWSPCDGSTMVSALRMESQGW